MEIEFGTWVRLRGTLMLIPCCSSECDNNLPRTGYLRLWFPSFYFWFWSSTDPFYHQPIDLYIYSTNVQLETKISLSMNFSIDRWNSNKFLVILFLDVESRNFSLILPFSPSKYLSRDYSVHYSWAWGWPWETLNASVVNGSPVSRRTASQTPAVSLSRDIYEVVRLLKMKPSFYQEDFNIEPVIYKPCFWCFPRIFSGPTS